jgi:hypothetical protein
MRFTGFIPNKKLVIIDGMPRVGKSTLTAEIAAKVSRGIPFPCGTVYEARSVAFIAVEDGMADTIKPRVEAAGGDGNRVYSIHIEQHGDEITPDLSEHMETIRERIIEDEIGFLINDPIMALLGDTADSYRDDVTTEFNRIGLRHRNILPARIEILTVWSQLDLQQSPNYLESKLEISLLCNARPSLSTLNIGTTRFWYFGRSFMWQFYSSN